MDSGEWEVESDADEAKPLAAPRSGFAKGKTRTRDLGDKSELFLDFGWPRFFFCLRSVGRLVGEEKDAFFFFYCSVGNLMSANLKIPPNYCCS